MHARADGIALHHFLLRCTIFCFIKLCMDKFAQQPRLGRLQSLGPNGFHRVAYTEWGDPLNPHVVICVHGLTRNSRDFDALAAALADSRRVVCMDVAGRGESDWLREQKRLRISALSVGRGGSDRQGHRAGRRAEARLSSAARRLRPCIRSIGSERPWAG